MKIKFLLIATSFAIANTGFAQSNTSISADTPENVSNESSKPWSVSLDAVPFLLSGLGIAVGYNLNESFNAELFAETTSVKDKDYDTASQSTKHETQSLGMRLGYFFNGANSSGAFVTGALGTTILKSTGKIDIPGILQQEKSVTSSHLLRQGFLGYQFAAKDFNKTPLILQAAAGLGSGGAFEVNYGGTTNDVKDGLLVQGSIGWKF